MKVLGIEALAIVVFGLSVGCSNPVSNHEETEIKFHVAQSIFEYEVTNTNNYTISISKSSDTVMVIDYWAMFQQPTNMVVLAEYRGDTLQLSYADTTSGTRNDWMPTVKTTAQIVVDSGIDKIQYVCIKNPGGRAPQELETASFRIANRDTVLVIP